MLADCSEMNNGDDIEGPNFDVKKFITEVELRPAIWDTRSRLYSDKQVKKECWDELVDILINKENPTEEERIEYCKILQRKWKSARDCFNRECQRLKMAKQGITTSRKSPYVFYKNLSFLHKVMNKNKSINWTKNSEAISNDASNSTDASSVSNMDAFATDISSVCNIDASSPNYADTENIEQSTGNNIYLVEDDEGLVPGPKSLRRPKRPKIEIEPEDEPDLTKMLQPSIQLIEGKAAQGIESPVKTPEDDSDRLFLLSLLEPLKEVPERLRLSVRVKLLQVIDSAMKFGTEMRHFD